MLSAREMNRAVPEELKILGFDDHPRAGVTGISTIRQPIKRWDGAVYACFTP